jgi:hypothetical protein
MGSCYQIINASAERPHLPSTPLVRTSSAGYDLSSKIEDTFVRGVFSRINSITPNFVVLWDANAYL